MTGRYHRKYRAIVVRCYLDAALLRPAEAVIEAWAGHEGYDVALPVWTAQHGFGYLYTHAGTLADARALVAQGTYQGGAS